MASDVEQDLAGTLGVGEEGVLGDLDGDDVRRDAGGLDGLVEDRAGSLPLRSSDGARLMATFRSRPARCQRAASATALRATTSESSCISPDRRATDRKAIGGIMPRSGCSQRTSASMPTVICVTASTFGWYQVTTCPLLQRAAQLLAHPQSLTGELVALGVVELGPGARHLGLVHGDVGSPQQVGGPGVAGLADGDAERGVHGEVHAIDLGRRQQGLPDGLGALEQVELVVLVDEDGELVAADPGQQDLGRERLAHAEGDELEQGVAGAVPESVVDLLEPVEVEQHQAQRPLRGDSVVERLAGRPGGWAGRSDRRSGRAGRPRPPPATRAGPPRAERRWPGG